MREKGGQPALQERWAIAGASSVPASACQAPGMPATNAG
jgi:hypothetical protein